MHCKTAVALQGPSQPLAPSLLYRKKTRKSTIEMQKTTCKPQDGISALPALL